MATIADKVKSLKLGKSFIAKNEQERKRALEAAKILDIPIRSRKFGVGGDRFKITRVL